MKKLTRRQRQFLSKFLDLYEKDREPLHYTTLAEHVGVNKISAYEMLQLLEEHGLVEAEYQLPSGLRGPGRASVVFRPTATAVQLISEMTGGDGEQLEWETVKEHILQQLEAGKPHNYDALLEELLLRTDEQRSPLIYVTEMTTAIILGLQSLQDTAEVHGLLAKLKEIGKVGEIGLSIFAGVGMGLTAAEHINRRLAGILLKQSSRFQTALSQLTDENRRRLTDFAREVMKIVVE